MYDGQVIYIIDDELSTLELLRFGLEDNYCVRGFTTGQAALAELEIHSPDLLLIDVQMPRMNGFDFFRRVRERESRHQIPVIMMSSTGGVEVAEEAMKMGAITFIEKPIHLDSFLVTIKSALC